MRIVVVDTYYPAFLASHYAARPGLEDRSYDKQLAALMARAFGTGEAYPRELRALGHEAHQVVANCPQLQAAWAGEHGAARRARATAALPTRVGIAAREALPTRILLAQLERLDPEVVYLQDLRVLAPDELAALRAAGRLVVGQIASPAPEPEVLRAFDLIVTSFPHYVERFRALGVDTEYLPIAFDQTLAPALDGAAVELDVVFAGGLHPHTHARGTALLEHAARALPLQVWGYGGEALAPDSPLRAVWRGEAWGMDMLRILAASRIVINRHIDVAEGHANNMRLFEATGAGALLLTDGGVNLGELFAPGEEVVTYDGADDLVAKARHLLAHEDERAAIAARGRARTLREHTYERRIATLAGILEARLAARG